MARSFGASPRAASFLGLSLPALKLLQSDLGSLDPFARFTRSLRVDLDHGRVRVERSLVSVRSELAFSEPKTKRGRRSIALDSATVAELRVHRTRQAEERLAIGLRGQDRDRLVFTDPLGQPITPDSFSQFFKRRWHS